MTTPPPPLRSDLLAGTPLHAGPWILAIDTTSNTGSIALVRGDRLIEEVLLQSEDGFAHVVYGAIESLLAAHNLRFQDLGGFAAASGPGSFTGVRVGLTAAKGLAEATHKKVVGVSNLEALAWYGTRPLRAPIMDARRNEIFGAVYGANLEPVRPEVSAPFEEWLAALPLGDLELITQGFPIPSRVNRPITHAPAALAAAVGVIAASRLAAGRAQDPADVEANYVRRSDAEMKWKDLS